MAKAAGRLAEECEVAIGELPAAEGEHAIVQPLVFVCRDAASAKSVHEVEVFGPSLTLMPYDGTAAQAAQLVAKGDGELVATAYSDDLEWTREILFGLAPWAGRVLLGSKRIAEHLQPLFITMLDVIDKAALKTDTYRPVHRDQ